MPARNLLARELAAMLKVIAHPDRIRIIEELRREPVGVSALSERLGVPPTRISQHLALLKAHKLVEEERDGRVHRYSLHDREIAEWVLGGAPFIERRIADEIASREMIETAKKLWRADAPDATSQ